MFRLTSFRIAIAALVRNRLRTGLTMLGIMVGIGAVICTVALGEGSAAEVHKQLDELGDNFVWLENGGRRVAGANTGAGGAERLSVEDTIAIAKEVPEIVRCSPQVDSRIQIIYGGQNWNTTYRGVSPDYLVIKRWPVVIGTAFSDLDVEANAKVVLLGRLVVDRLFGDEDPIDKIIRIGNLPFRVLGILKTKGQSVTGQDQDDTVFIPYTTVMHLIKRQRFVDDAMCSATSAGAIPMAQSHIEDLIRDRHHILPGQADDFNIRSPEDAIKTREEATRTMGLMLSAIASVSLLVGGIGIMNIMLVSVAERTREIGLRMAIGARQADVQGQFLAEALVLGLAGGALGVGAGFLGAGILTRSFGWPMLISGETIAIAVGFASGVGLVFGYYPARHAAQLDPIDALRAE